MTDEGLLYHYTSAPGLLGIIKNRAVWATESNTLNDPTEISYAAQEVVEALEAKHGGAPASSRIAIAIGLLRDAYVDPHSPSQYQEDRSYITSFSRTDDSLTLWRMYAGANGFCIGFDEEQLQNWVPGEWLLEEERALFHPEEFEGKRANVQFDSRVEDVMYGAVGLASLVEEIEEIARQGGNDLHVESAMREAFRRLAAVKHQSFADEREVRVIVRRQGHHAADPSTRVGANGMLAAYLNVHFPYQAVKTITTAPGANVARVHHTLRALLADGGRGDWEQVKLRESPLQFSW